MLEIEAPPTGVKPQCVYFGVCGGCSYQDLTYLDQLELKRNKVEETLRALKYFSSDLLNPVIPSPKPYLYRHMIALSVMKRQGVLRLGFIGQDRWTFIPIESCSIADGRINQFIPHTYAKLEELPIQRRFRTSQVVLRVGESGEVITSLRMDRGKEFECTVLGKKFSYSLSSFFQHNFSILDSFVNVIHSFLNPTAKGTLFDLYSGVGLLGISLSDSFEKIIGIEEGYEAVQHAKQNAVRNHVTNTSFFEGKVETLLPDLISRANEPLYVVVDPPRKGLKPEVVEVLLKVPIERLVYVSCELSALKRDLELLENQFLIERVQPLDFFPQTKHIETIVSLIPRK